MPRPDPNAIHINAVLIMLPFDEALAKKTVGLSFEHQPNSDIYSFHDAHHRPVHYKLIAKSDKPGEFGRGHDGAAFLRVDEHGHALNAQGKPPAPGEKPQVIVAFPGFNDKRFPSTDAASALQDGSKTTSFEEGFFRDFVHKKLEPALKNQGMGLHEVEVVGHSMGDKFAYEYVVQHHTRKAMVIDGFDRVDAAQGAASRNALHDAQMPENKDPAQSRLEFSRVYSIQMTSNLNRLRDDVVEVNAEKPMNFGITKADDAVLAKDSFKIKGAGHRTPEFLFKTDRDVEQFNAAQDHTHHRVTVNEVMHNAFSNLNETLSRLGIKTTHGTDGLEKVENLLLADLKNTLKAQGGEFTMADEHILENVREKLQLPGVQAATMKEVQATYLRGAAATENGGISKK